MFITHNNIFERNSCHEKIYIYDRFLFACFSIACNIFKGVKKIQLNFAIRKRISFSFNNRIINKL